MTRARPRRPPRPTGTRSCPRGTGLPLPSAGDRARRWRELLARGFSGDQNGTGLPLITEAIRPGLSFVEILSPASPSGPSSALGDGAPSPVDPTDDPRAPRTLMDRRRLQRRRALSRQPPALPAGTAGRRQWRSREGSSCYEQTRSQETGIHLEHCMAHALAMEVEAVERYESRSPTDGDPQQP